MIDIRISLDGDDQTPDAASLYQWLHAVWEGQRQRPARLVLRQKPPSPGRMGGEQFVQIFLDHPEIIDIVVSTLIMWYTTLRRRPTVRLERNGETFIIENLTDEELRRILGAVEDSKEYQEKDDPNDDR